MKTHLFALALLVLALPTFGQTAEVKLQKAAQSYINAFVSKDVSTILRFTHPQILERGGGEKFVSQDITAEFDMNTKTGLDYVDGKVMLPDASFKIGEEVFYVVPHTWVVEIAGNTYKSDSYLLGCTKDAGESWSFVNLNKYNAADLAMYIDGFDDKMEFPQATPFEQITE
jgi:hypothetical protein